MTGDDRVAIVDGCAVSCTVAGDGPVVVLLLHGFPETREAWRPVVDRLSADPGYTLVAPDLPGYGDSDRLGDGPESFEKGLVAGHLVRFMAELGHHRFTVIGHDRGGLVAFRMALEHPDVVDRLGVLDILPTVDNWAALVGPAGVFAFHLYLLAQPDDFPERLIGAAPELFFGHFLDGWTKATGAIPDDVRGRYLQACSRPETIHAICDDYRASALLDGARDATDQAAGQVISVPMFAAWQDPGDTPLPFDPEQIWRSWSGGDPVIEALPCGHFLPEEAPDRVAALFAELVRR